MINIAILALQGNFEQHKTILNTLNDADIRIHLIRNKEDVLSRHYHALVLPGGESSTILKLLEKQQMTADIVALINSGIPVLATCAGVILLSKKILVNNLYSIDNSNATHIPHSSLEILDISILRNAYGRQNSSFYTELDFKPMPVPSSHNTSSNMSTELPATLSTSSSKIKGMFIRAPKILHYPDCMHIVSTYEGCPVILQDDRYLLSTFHPESAQELSLHRYFVAHMLKKN